MTNGKNMFKKIFLGVFKMFEEDENIMIYQLNQGN